MRVTAWHKAHRMDLAPGGSCSGVRQVEQSTSISIVRIKRGGESMERKEID